MNIINRVFGWNAKAWNHPFSEALKDFPVIEGARILEIGANRLSAISLLFIESKCELNITAYPCNLVAGLEAFVNDFKNNNKYENSYININCMSFTNVIGEYDLILMKSVLGGIFGLGTNEKDSAEEKILEIVNNNLKPGGVLITLDNGKTIFEKMFLKFGARKKGWRFFVPADFRKYTRQYCFGTLTNFSFVTRIGRMGQLFEDFIYAADCILGKIFKISKPSVIVTVYKR